MNNTTPQLVEEFIWRRLEEPAELFGKPLPFENPAWWLALAVPLLLLALLRVGVVYWRESRTVGKGWAALLGSLRALVYLALFFLWLMPAIRQVEYTQKQPRVLVLFDVSGSMQMSDAPVQDKPGPPPPTRMEELLTLFQAKPVTQGATPEPDLITRLGERNPLIGYRFGQQLDPQSWPLTPGANGTLPNWTLRLQPRSQPGLDQLFDDALLRSLSRAGRLWYGAQAEAKEPLTLQEVERETVAAQNSEQKPGAAALRARTITNSLENSLSERQRIAQLLLGGTNLSFVLDDLLDKEPAESIHAVIIISDGHQTETDDAAKGARESALAKARKYKLPILTVGIGKNRFVPNLRLTNLLAPRSVQPEDTYPLRAVIEGENVAAGQEVTVTLKIDKPNNTSEEIVQTVRLTPVAKRKTGGQVEFRINNPQKLIGKWKFSARVTPLPGESTRADNATLDPVVVTVEEGKLRVLLAASAPMHEYHFLRTLLLREPDKFDVTLCLQSIQYGSVQDINPKKLLKQFPNKLRPRDVDPLNLANYDVIIALDVDWLQLVDKDSSSPDGPTQELLKRWVEKLGGGLIVAAGPVHTFNLARNPQLETIRSLYPVVLDDTASSINIIDRTAISSWALNWDIAAAQRPYFNLTDTADRGRVLEGWERFFNADRDPTTGQADKPSKHGFYSFFPVKEVKTGAGAIVLARFSDPERKFLMPNGQRQPYFVEWKPFKGQIFYMGSAETYRLREYSEKYHERFWTKLLRAYGKREQSRGLGVVGSRYPRGETVIFEASLLDPAMEPLPRLENLPKLLLNVRPPASAPDAKPFIVLEEGMAAYEARAWEFVRQARNLPNDTPEETRRKILEDMVKTGQYKETLERLMVEAVKGEPGKFRFRIPANWVGTYSLSLKIPDSEDALTANFETYMTDPERDDIQPDLNFLYQLASPANEVPLLDERKRADFNAALTAAKARMLAQKQELEQMEGTTADNAENKPAADPKKEEPVLYFDLGTATWMAECLESKPETNRTEGKISDIWDKGITVFRDLRHPDEAEGPPWALLLLVTLLGGEWLARKLLRLA
jgi:hypothetical protein